MVAKIESGKSLTGALYYNENKVSAGKAHFLFASGYTKNDDLLSFNDKLFRLSDLAERNLRTKTNTVHLSLNFDIKEKLDDDTLINIADEYMKRIGFENQPYLIYKHNDAGHPHIHVLSTNIKSDGKRISLNNIGKLTSEPARKAIELEFGLIKASGKSKNLEDLKEFQLKPLSYGQTDTKRAITNIVNHVAKSYKYTSLPELNAVLNLYNVTAYRGTKESVMYTNGGLNYWVTDQNGKRLGVPIKASSIYSKPTLKLLEGRFKLNNYLRKPLREKLKIKIDAALARSTSLEQLKSNLKSESVNIVIRQNQDGRIYGLTFIDHFNKLVYNGSDIGTKYSTAAILNTLQERSVQSGRAFANVEHTARSLPIDCSTVSHPSGQSLLDNLLNPFDANLGLPNQFGPKKRKKKSRNLNL